jgi:Tfp pilus assembly protein PilN
LIALEFQATSFSRITSFENNKTVLIKTISQSSTSFFIVKNSTTLFLKTLSNNLPEKKITEEPEKIINFYESGTGEKISALVDLAGEPILIKEKIEFPELNKNPWLAAIGAALRGISPRQEDTFISLSPISPQKAYKYHKAVSFTSILTKLVIGLSIFFAASFLGTWVMMITLQQQEAGKTDDINNLPSMPDLTAVEQKIQTANTLISNTAGILKNSPQWSILIGELKGKIIDGITINSLNMPSAESAITITGMAQNRQILNNFRDKLKSSEMLTNIKLPLTNLEQREGIPFTISFQLKNPQSIYFK